MNRLGILGLIVLLMVGCGGPPTPTPDIVATQVVQQLAVAATLTASAPTATNTAVPTDTPTATPTSTPTVAPTNTPPTKLTGNPMDYTPTEREMPAGFAVDPSLSQPSPGVKYPMSAVAYSRGIFDMVAYVVIVAPDETSARTVYQQVIGDPTLGSSMEVAVSGVDQHASFESNGGLLVKTFLRERNVVAAVACGGEAKAGADWYVALLTRKLQP